MARKQINYYSQELADCVETDVVEVTAQTFIDWDCRSLKLDGSLCPMPPLCISGLSSPLSPYDAVTCLAIFSYIRATIVDRRDDDAYWMYAYAIYAPCDFDNEMTQRLIARIYAYCKQCLLFGLELEFETDLLPLVLLNVEAMVYAEPYLEFETEHTDREIEDTFTHLSNCRGMKWGRGTAMNVKRYRRLYEDITIYHSLERLTESEQSTLILDKYHEPPHLWKDGKPQALVDCEDLDKYMEAISAELDPIDELDLDNPSSNLIYTIQEKAYLEEMHPQFFLSEYHEYYDPNVRYHGITPEVLLAHEESYYHIVQGTNMAYYKEGVKERQQRRSNTRDTGRSERTSRREGRRSMRSIRQNEVCAWEAFFVMSQLDKDMYKEALENLPEVVTQQADEELDEIMVEANGKLIIKNYLMMLHYKRFQVLDWLNALDEDGIELPEEPTRTDIGQPSQEEINFNNVVSEPISARTTPVNKISKETNMDLLNIPPELREMLKGLPHPVTGEIIGEELINEEAAVEDDPSLDAPVEEVVEEEPRRLIHHRRSRRERPTELAPDTGKRAQYRPMPKTAKPEFTRDEDDADHLETIAAMDAAHEAIIKKQEEAVFSLEKVADPQQGFNDEPVTELEVQYVGEEAGTIVTTDGNITMDTDVNHMYVEGDLTTNEPVMVDHTPIVRYGAPQAAVNSPLDLLPLQMEDMIALYERYPEIPEGKLKYGVMVDGTIEPCILPPVDFYMLVTPLNALRALTDVAKVITFEDGREDMIYVDAKAYDKLGDRGTAYLRKPAINEAESTVLYTVTEFGDFEIVVTPKNEEEMEDYLKHQCHPEWVSTELEAPDTEVITGGYGNEQMVTINPTVKPEEDGLFTSNLTVLDGSAIASQTLTGAVEAAIASYRDKNKADVPANTALETLWCTTEEFYVPERYKADLMTAHDSFANLSNKDTVEMSIRELLTYLPVGNNAAAHLVQVATKYCNEHLDFSLYTDIVVEDLVAEGDALVERIIAKEGAAYENNAKALVNKTKKFIVSVLRNIELNEAIVDPEDDDSLTDLYVTITVNHVFTKVPWTLSSMNLDVKALNKGLLVTSETPYYEMIEAMNKRVANRCFVASRTIVTTDGAVLNYLQAAGNVIQFTLYRK